MHGPDVVCRAVNDALLEGLVTVTVMESSQAAAAAAGGDGDGDAYGGNGGGCGRCTTQRVDLPLLSDYDKTALQVLGSTYELDWVALSYTRSGAEVEEV